MYLERNALTGRTVLVTGASRGIGAVTARALADANAHVIAHSRRQRDWARDAISALPPEQRHVIEADLGTPAGARDLWRQALAWRGIVDVAVLNAAVIPRTPIDGPDDEWDAGWEEALRVNVIGTGALMREAVRYFVARGGGTVIVLSSWAAQQGSRIPDATSYAASKAAIRNLAQTFARTYAQQGLLVYVLAPGVVDVGMSVDGLDEVARQAVASGLAMGRHVKADEIASLVVFLSSGACPSLTGSTLDINGASYVR